MPKIRFLLFLLPLLVGCFNSQLKLPTSNVCNLLDEKVSWYQELKKIENNSKINMALILAIIKQESNFVSNARPERKKILGIPLISLSSAYGYAQAKDTTWNWYKNSTKKFSAKRDNFNDAADFISWYILKTNYILGIANDDYYNNYLAYHEGHGGFKRGSYKNKKWLINVAKKVSFNAKKNYDMLVSCRTELDKNQLWNL